MERWFESLLFAKSNEAPCLRWVKSLSCAPGGSTDLEWRAFAAMVEEEDKRA
jgi:hypothetical protein